MRDSHSLTSTPLRLNTALSTAPSLQILGKVLLPRILSYSTYYLHPEGDKITSFTEIINHQLPIS